MQKVAYLALDVHAKNSVLGQMDFNGKFIGNQSFSTSEINLISALQAVKEKEKYLVLEESTLAYWAAQVAAPYVTQVVSCDPKENYLIYRSPHKRDKIDTRKLCRLLRLGEVKHVYQPSTDDRAVFKASARHYIDLRDQQVRLKFKIKAMYRYWGIIDVFGGSVYSIKGRERYLERIKNRSVQNQLLSLYQILDQTEQMQHNALKEMKRLGRKYPEIREFIKIPGIGDIGAHFYSAFIQTPDRFVDKRKVWRYCQLGVSEFTSDGKPLGYKRLDKTGVAELKAVSYRAWMSCLKSDNEVHQFFSRSLHRTLNRVHARLNTQRKIVAVMYGLWKRGEAYNPQAFSGSS